MKNKPNKLLHDITNLLIENISNRILYPMLFQVYSNIINQKYIAHSLMYFFYLMILIAKKLTHDIADKQCKRLFKFYLNSFKLREKNVYNSQEINQIENMIINSFIHLLLKLNEHRLNIFYIKLLDWSNIKQLINQYLLQQQNVKDEDDFNEKDEDDFDTKGDVPRV